MNTILYATDYSENAVAALKYGYSLSKELKARLLVIHVFDIPTILGTKMDKSIPHLEKDAYKEHTTKLEEFCQKHLGKKLDNVNVKAIENTSVIDGIISMCKSTQPLLIVTGMKGGSILRELIMGNTTKLLIDKAPCPVLAIPNDTSYNKIKIIVYATDCKEEDFGAINKLTEIASPLNAKIKIVHIAPLSETIGKGEKKYLEERLHAHINYSNFEVDILNSDNVFNSLKIYFGKSNADIIAMLECESSTITSAIFNRDLVKRMESYGRIPLLSFNAKNYSIFHI